MKLLGIDFGESKIGLAYADVGIAEPLRVIYKPDLLTKIINVCHLLQIEKIIIGVSEGKSAEKTIQFGAQLMNLVSLPIEYQDETLTTQDAIAKMKEIGKRVKDEDAISAALILQNYLDKPYV
jgi:putative holliday junction resolvase